MVVCGLYRDRGPEITNSAGVRPCAVGCALEGGGGWGGGAQLGPARPVSPPPTGLRPLLVAFWAEERGGALYIMWGHVTEVPPPQTPPALYSGR